MLQLSKKWAQQLNESPETGMAYQIVSIILKDGRRFDQVVIIEGLIAQIRGRNDIPFSEDDIQEIVVTHDKWDWKNQ